VDGYRGNRACIDELLDPSSLGGGKHVLRAAEIGVVDFFRVLSPQPVVCCNMKDTLNAVHGPIERSGITQVPGHIFERQVGNRAILARWPQQHADVFSPCNQLPRYMAAQEPCRACNQRRHWSCTLSSVGGGAFTKGGGNGKPGSRSVAGTGNMAESSKRESSAHRYSSNCWRAAAIVRCRSAA